MDPVEFRDIAYILAVSEEQGFSRAAEKYYISQPALSKTVRKAEQKLGVTLFDRGSVPLKLTPEGARVIEYFRRLQGVQQELSDYCAALHRQKKSDLCIGAPSFFCTYVLPAMISDFQALHPGVSVRLIETNDHDLREFLQANVLDIGLSVESDLLADFPSFILQYETIILAVPKAFSVNGQLGDFVIRREDLLSGRLNMPDPPCVPMEVFAKESFLFLKKGNDMHRRGLQVCHDAGFEPRVVIELDQLMTSYYLAQAGRGIAFIRAGIPYYAGESDSLLLYKHGHPDMRRIIRVFHNREGSLTPVQKDFLDFMKGYPLPA